MLLKSKRPTGAFAGTKMGALLVGGGIKDKTFKFILTVKLPNSGIVSLNSMKFLLHQRKTKFTPTNGIKWTRQCLVFIGGLIAQP